MTTEAFVPLAPGYRPVVLDEGAGPVLVLLHGTPFDVRAWAPLVASLGGSRRTVRFDARGHGSAVAVPIPDYGRLASDVVALLDALGLPAVHLVGHSWGGQVAQRVALDHPDRVHRLSLLCTRASPFPAFAGAAASLRDGTLAPEASLARWFTPDELAASDGIVASVRQWLHEADRSRWADAMDMIATFDVLGRLCEVAVPTDVVAAEHDGVSTPEQMSLIADAVPDAAFHVLPGARHLAPLQRPDEIARVLTG